MDQGKDVGVNKYMKRADVLVCTDILYDLIDSVKGANADATASAIFNIVETLLPQEYSDEYINNFLIKLQEELDNHIGG